nr:MAG TPA: hypothetical protein [Bacteriophage sp.]
MYRLFLINQKLNEVRYADSFYTVVKFYRLKSIT